MRKQIGGDVNTQVEINTQEINTLTNQVNQLKSFVDSLEKSSSQPSGEGWKAQSVESIQQSREQRPTEQTPTPVQEQAVAPVQQAVTPVQEQAVAPVQQQQTVTTQPSLPIPKNSQFKAWSKGQGIPEDACNNYCTPWVTLGSQTPRKGCAPKSSVKSLSNADNFCKVQCPANGACGSSGGKKTNKRKNKRSNKKSSRKQRAGDLCQQNRCQQLSLMNDKLNIYAPYPNNSGPFPASAFTGNYRIDGPLPRGTTVPQAIHQVNLRKNVYPGGKTKKNKLNKRKTKRRN